MQTQRISNENFYTGHYLFKKNIYNIQRQLI